MKKHVLLIFSVILCLCSIPFESQAQNIFSGEPVQVVGSMNGYSTAASSNSAYRLISTNTSNPLDGRGQWMKTYNVQTAGGDFTPVSMVGGGGNGFLFISGPSGNRFQNKWVFSGVAQAGLNTINNITAYNFGDDMGLNMSVAGRYTFVFNDVGYTQTNAKFYVGYTSNAPVTVSNIGVTYAAGQPSILIGSSATPSPGENIYVRYRVGTNDFTAATSVVQATGSGTSWSATLPTQACSTTAFYYIFTSTRTLAELNSSSETDKALSALRYSDNAGNNHSFTVGPLPTVTASNVSGCAGMPIALAGSPMGGTFSEANPYEGPSTTYTYTYTDPDTGCTATSSAANVIVTPPTTNGSITVTECDTYTWAANGLTYTETGIYTHVVGCNTATLDLTIFPTTTNNSLTTTACGTYTWAENDNTYIVSGSYTFVTGCNTATLDLTILPVQTPEVVLTSSDEDNFFFPGTSVTFTATPSNLAGGTATYDFKVDGASVQTGASNSFTTSSLTNLQAVSVEMTVSGGTCLTSNMVESNTIINSVGGTVLVDFIYQGNYCGTTATSTNPTFYASSPDVGASTLTYRFRITNTVTNAVALVDRTVPNANLLLANLVTPGIVAFNTLYTVEVAGVLDGALQPYSGPCTVTTPALPVNQVVSTQCGTGLAELNSVIYVTTVTGATTYRFKVWLAGAPGTFEEVTSPFSSFRLSSLTSIPLDYGNTYTIQVQTDVLNNGMPATSAYGPACEVTTPPVTIVTSTPNACGSTLGQINGRIYVNSVPGAVQYTYRVALASSPMTYYSVMSPFTNFRLTSVPGLPLIFDTTYNISVNVTINVNGSNVDTGFGSAFCQYTTPNFPTSQLQTSQCVMPFYEVPSNTTSLVADFVSGASYRFKIENVPSGAPFSQTITRPVSNFKLNMFTGLMPGTEYKISVAVDLYGSGPFGAACTIKTPGMPIMPTRVLDTPFSAKAYPNPFASTFTVGVTTKSASNVSIIVYDMLGRLIESRDAKVADLVTTTIGEQYPAGVYNVIITQDADVSSVRMIKR